MFEHCTLSIVSKRDSEPACWSWSPSTNATAPIRRMPCTSVDGSHHSLELSPGVNASATKEWAACEPTGRRRKRTRGHGRQAHGATGLLVAARRVSHSQAPKGERGKHLKLKPYSTSNRYPPSGTVTYTQVWAILFMKRPLRQFNRRGVPVGCRTRVQRQVACV